MLEHALIVSSPTSKKDKTQTSLVYLSTILNKLNVEYDLADLSGTIDYFDPPREFFSQWNSKHWLSSKIFYDAKWLDNYLPKDFKKYNAIFYSALFSPDIFLHGRHSINQKNNFPDCKTIIGGQAISCLNQRQLSVLSDVFDYVCADNNIGKLIQPNYELTNIKDFITIYSGDGCNWNKCRFCNSKKIKYHTRPAVEIASDLEQIARINPDIKDVMLSSDSFTRKDLIEIASCLKKKESKIPYNIMLRGESWITEKISKLLHESGCTDVFIGAESLNNEILKIVNKGTNTKNITNAVENLSNYMKVTLGLMLFIPHITEKQLEKQLLTLEKILPYVYDIEPEILSVIQGTEFACHSEKYGIKLWATNRTINDSWCYGLSPDIPWTFSNPQDAKTWFKHYDKLKNLIKDFVQPHYWDSIDYVRERWNT